MNDPNIPQQQRFLALFNTPISFYGRVVDETGLPVPGASAQMKAADKPWGDGTLYERLANETGFFEITGIRGAELYVQVTKDGFRQKGGSRRSFRYAGPPSTATAALPSKNAPAVFVLERKGEPAPLIHISERPIQVPKNGVAVEVSLRNGHAVAGGQGDLQVEIWTEDSQRDNEGRYPWRGRITIPGGGLVERTDPYAFEAPPDGYRSSVELKPPTEKWSSRIEKNYFVALPDGRFGRLEFRLRTDGEHYFVIESFLNATPGNRNLEYEAAKAVQIAN